MRFAAIVVSLLFVLSALMPAPGLAEADKYYIEIGKETSGDEAQQQWESLSKKHSSLLGNLKFFPKTVMQAGTGVATRIQAGPLNSKSQAQKICSRLFSSGVSCFVIEGVDEAPPTHVVSLSERSEERRMDAVNPGELQQTVQAEPLEDMQSQTEETVDKGESDSFMPWLFGPSKKSGEAQNPNVKVAEAIRVPLTERNDPAQLEPYNVRPEAEPPTMPAPMTQTRRRPQTFAQEAGGYWLKVGGFADESRALDFWQSARVSVPHRAGSLRVRIVKPLLSRYEARTMLVIGPFNQTVEAEEFCRDAVRPVDSALKCQFTDAAPSAPQAPGLLNIAPRYQHEKGYIARRSRIQSMRSSSSLGARGAQASVPQHKGSHVYWVEVLSAASEMAALSKWEDLRTTHSDLLSGRRSSIAASLGERMSYLVRVGPMGSHGEAQSLCGRLKEREVPCRVLYFSTN